MSKTPTKRAFTLVELLVVIGIIALLVAILLPALGAARRQANTTKCMSNLRSIGQAMFLYAHDHKGYLPAAVHHGQNTFLPLVDPEIRWPDRLAPYVAKARNITYSDMTEIQDNSVIWGCPAWTKDLQSLGSTPFAQGVRVGYGMSFYPDPAAYFGGSTPDSRKIIYFPRGAVQGMYSRLSQWVKPAEHGIIADDTFHIIEWNWEKRNDVISMNHSWNWQPYSSGALPDFLIDGFRHLKPGATKQQTFSQRGINMLFCDGHVATVNIPEAWNAVVWPGESRASP